MGFDDERGKGQGDGDMTDRYKFDGFDAVVDAEDGGIVYDGLDGREGEIIARLLNEIEDLTDALEKERNRSNG